MVEPSSREYLSASGASFFFALKEFFCVNMLIYENQMLTKHDMKENNGEIIRKRILFNR